LELAEQLQGSIDGPEASQLDCGRSVPENHAILQLEISKFLAMFLSN
jgi:hypothetical protein